MQDWYQPDPIWEALGITQRETYVRRHVFAGRFHAAVPTDVVRAYGTAAHLMAQAWHHYPLYDEAIKKLLFTLEMAIKLRCQQVGLALSIPTAAGRQRAVRLQELIDQLATAEPQKGVLLRERLHFARELRNTFAHPDRYSYGGVMLRHHVLPLLNIFNFLFLAEVVVAQAAAYVAQLREQCPPDASLLGLTWQGQHLVLTRAQPLLARRRGEEWRVMWAFYPLRSGLYEALTRHQVHQPLLLTLLNPRVEAGELVGLEQATGQPVALTVAPAGVAELLLPGYHADWARATATDRQIFEFSQQAALTQEVEEQLYAHFWQEQEIDG
jgi:hypothetical protein